MSTVPNELYQELGVSPDATPEELKAAHREAVKRSHPDKEGGSAEAFARVQEAWLVLSDPEKRSRYDATGEAEKVEPDNELGKIADIVIAAFDSVIDQVNGDFAHNDIIDLMRDFLDERIDLGDETNATIEARREEMVAMQARLSCQGETDLISRELANRIENAGRQIAGNNAIKELHRKALEHIEIYGWKVDAQPTPTTTATTYEAMVAQYHEQSMKFHIGGQFFNNPGA